MFRVQLCMSHLFPFKNSLWSPWANLEQLVWKIVMMSVPELWVVLCKTQIHPVLDWGMHQTHGVSGVGVKLEWDKVVPHLLSLKELKSYTLRPKSISFAALIFSGLIQIMWMDVQETSTEWAHSFAFHLRCWAGFETAKSSDWMERSAISHSVKEVWSLSGKKTDKERACSSSVSFHHSYLPTFVILFKTTHWSLKLLDT